jgi:C-terminal processing protease CtpA/Prc
MTYAVHTRHRRSVFRLAALFLLASLLLAACSLAPQAAEVPTAPAASPAPAPTAAATAATSSEQPTASQATTGGSAPTTGLTQLTGKFTYSNDIITTYYVEQAAALIDMYGFVKRDKEWEIPVDSQVLGFMKIDEKSKSGEYTLELPAKPLGTMIDVNHDGKNDTGVQIFVTSYSPNQAGGPFSEGDDRSRGWPSYLASTVNDAENQDEVTGGKLVVWAPDGQQQFPTGFGTDGKLFTDDDPEGPIPAGYSVVDLDKQPFAISQDAKQDLTLYEPKDAAIKDFSKLGYGDAFKQMFDKIRQDYAFNGIAGKEPNWDDLYAQLAPRVAEAEKNKDARAFYLALFDFTRAFHDGHVGLSGGEAAATIFQEQAAAGYGFAIRQLDDKRYIVTYLVKGGPAEKAGIALGDEVTKFNDKPIDQAVAQVQPLSGPFSTDFALKYQRQRYLLRAPLGANASITFAPAGKPAKTATLTAVEDRESFAATSLYRGFDPNALPVEFSLLASGVGYVKINSNYDDLNLIIRLFERALKTFEQNQSPGVIIDMRQNSGGAPLGLAGFLTDKTITMGQLEYRSDKTGKFEPEGPPEKFYPNEHQYSFNKLALLVGQACASACELESYGFSQVPGMIVVGQYPSAGIEAEVSRGQFMLPDGISLQVPTGRFRLPDGSLFLEGQGVQPTMRVPIDEKSVLSPDDVVLQAAEDALAK